MLKTVVFHKSIKGASHIIAEKPCQDYSDSYQDDEIQIVVVCDGHGGSTYFRSDIGAKFATEITIQMLKDFARCVPPSSFMGISFSITAQPQKNPFIDTDGHKLRFDELGEDQKKLARQAQSFFDSEDKYSEQQVIIKELLSQIYNEWKKRIEQDAKRYSFDSKERKILKGLGIEKAYGCTLLAFLQTKDYWLSFHIGDGSITTCDHSLTWNNPVPDDCACFLNYTTSLCDKNPLIEFRYAFNGINEPPLAIMLCSDGLDGSLRTDDNLQDFYEQIIGLCLDGDDVEVELDNYLPSLSESGNKDDISIAGIISLNNIDEENLRNKMFFKKRSRTVQSDYRAKKTEIESISSRIDVLKIKLERMKDTRRIKQNDLDELRRITESREMEISELDKSVDTLEKEMVDLISELRKKETDLDNWKFTVKNEMAELESAQSEQKTEDEENNHINYTNW